MRHVEATIDGLRRLRGWAARTFLRPASITLVSQVTAQRVEGAGAGREGPVG